MDLFYPVRILSVLAIASLLCSCGNLFVPRTATTSSTPVAPPATPVPPCTGGTAQKVYVGGSFQSLATNTLNFFSVFSSTAALAPCYTAVPNQNVRAVVVSPTGSYIYAAGLFSQVNGSAQSRLVRYNPEGVLDTTFAIGSGFNGNIYALAADTFDSVFAVGTFTQFNGTSSPGIAKVLADGTLDTSFVVGTGFNFAPFAIALDALGNVLVGGNFTTYNGAPAPRVARLDSAGVLDATFVPGTGPNGTVFSIAYDASTPNIYLGGSFTSYNGTASRRIVRLDNLGALDATFAIGTAFDNTIYSLALTTGAPPQVYAAGAQTLFAGGASVGVTRIDNAGTLDATFSSGTGPDSVVYSVTLSADTPGSIYLGGAFANYNGLPAPYLARVDGTGALDTAFSALTPGPVSSVASW